MQIASVDGTRFTLETVDQPTPQVFVFGTFIFVAGLLLAISSILIQRKKV